MNVLDRLFKLYFSFFRSMGRAGAHSAIMLLTAPLTFNLYVILLIVVSFIIDIGELGGLLFSIGVMSIGILVLFFLEYVYVLNERYKKMNIKNPRTNYFFGTLYFIMSNLMFSIVAILLLSK